MLESPRNLESSRDPFTGALWWTESSFDGSPCRNSSFARVNGSLRRLKEFNEPGRELDLSMDASRKKLTWISREDHRSSSSRNLASNDRLLIQNGSLHGRSGRFGGEDSPRRGFQSPAESPARRAESVRRIRTPSMDFDTTEVSSNSTTSRLRRSLNQATRSASFKESSAATAAASSVSKSHHTEVNEASAVWRGLTSTTLGCDQRTAHKPPVKVPTKDDYSPRFSPSGVASPEHDRMVVSYLAEETDRIIKERIQKLKLRYNPNVADQLRSSDHERSSAGEVMATNGCGRRLPSRHLETYDMNRDQLCVGDSELNDESSNSPASSTPGSPSLPIYPLLPQYNGFPTTGEGHSARPTRKISPTMENYLDNRATGTGPQIVVPPRRTVAPILSLPASSLSTIAVIRQDEPENPSMSSNVTLVARHESLTASARAALSPINGNEDVAYSTPFLSQRKGELYSAGEPPLAAEDPTSRRSSRILSTNSQRIGSDFSESVPHLAENVFPSRLEHRGNFVRNGVDMDSGESPLTQFTQQSEQRTSPSGRKLDLRTKTFPPLGVHSNGAGGGGHSSQTERGPFGGSARHSAAARNLLGQNHRFEPEVGKSLLSDKVLRAGSRDNHNASRRSQSCRRDSIINCLLDSTQDNEAHPLPASRSKSSALPSGHDTSSNSKKSSRPSVNMRARSSSDNLPKPSPILSQIEKQELLVPDLYDHKSSPRRISTAAPESRGTSMSSSRRPSIAGPPESIGSPLSLRARMSAVSGSESGGKPRRRISVGGHEAGSGSPLSISRSYSATRPEPARSPLLTFSQPLQGSNSPLLMQVNRPRLSVGGHEAGNGSPLSISRSYSATHPELGGSPMETHSAPLQGSNSPLPMQVSRAKLQRKGTSSQTKSGVPHLYSPIQGFQLSAKKNNALQQERPKTSHKSSLSLDQQDTYKRLYVQTKKDNQNGQPVTTSTSVSQVCSISSSMTVARPQPPSSPGSSFQRWLTNQFKVGSKPRSSSTGKNRDPQEDPKPRKKSPWRTRPAEILQVLTRKKGSSTRPAAEALSDANSFQNVQQANSLDSPISASDPWHHRMMHTESGSTPQHRKSYMLPSVSTMSPARSQGLQRHQ